MSFLGKLALLLHRSSDELQKSSLSQMSRKRVIIFALSLFLLASIWLISLLFEIYALEHTNPTVPVSVLRRHYLVEKQQQECVRSGMTSVGCVANPNNPVLWQSSTDFATLDKDFFFGDSKGNPFWIGLVVPKEEIDRAIEANANQFVFGRIRGAYSVWVDGEYISQGSKSFCYPITIPFTILKLKKATSIHVAIRILPDAGRSFAYPVIDEFMQGFSNQKTTNDYFRRIIIFETVRPLISIGIDLIAAIFFFLFWIYAHEKQEYFYMAIYALFNTMVHARSMSLFLVITNLQLNHSISLVLRLAEGTFAYLIGASFARTKQKVINIGIYFSLVLVTILVALTLHDEGAKVWISRILRNWAGTIGCILGGLICLIQAYYLKNSKEKSFAHSRAVRLFLFSLGLFVAAALFHAGFFGYYGQSVHVSAVERGVYFSKLGNIILVLYLSILAIFDFRDQKQMLAKAPISKYHRLPALPHKISGAMLVVDLKNSEGLFELGAKTGESGKLVEICLSHMWTAVIQHQGILLSTEGDLIRVFFDREYCDNPVLSAVRSTEEMMKSFYLLQGRFANLAVQGAEIPKLTFRGAIATGEIKPVWQDVGDLRYASWIETGSTHPFVESARLMELERQFQCPTPTSQVVILDTDLARLGKHLSELVGSWTNKSKIGVGKQGKKYQVSLYNPEPLRSYEFAQNKTQLKPKNKARKKPARSSSKVA